MENKKGQLGLSTVKAVMIVFLILAVIGVVTILALTSIRDVADDIDKSTVGIVNLTTESKVNETGAYISGTSGLRNCVATLTSGINQTSKTAINATDLTSTGCLVQFDGDAPTWYNNSLWNVTGSYTYSDARVTNLVSNVTDANVSFFGSTGTIFAILIVVVIILAISIILAVVSGFGKGGGIGGGRSGGFGSDTVGGI